MLITINNQQTTYINIDLSTPDTILEGLKKLLALGNVNKTIINQLSFIKEEQNEPTRIGETYMIH